MKHLAFNSLAELLIQVVEAFNARIWGWAVELNYFQKFCRDTVRQLVRDGKLHDSP